MLCKHGDQFLRRYIICIQLHGSQFPEPGNFRNDIVQFVFLGFPFGYLVLDRTLPFFQDPFLHSVLLQCRRISFVVLRFIEIDGLDHQARDSGFSLRRFRHYESVQVCRFPPVRLCLHEVFALDAACHDRYCGSTRHIHGRLRGFGYRLHIRANSARQCVNRKRRQRNFLKRDRRFPLHLFRSVILLRWDISRLLFDETVVFQSTFPDAVQFLPIKSRNAFFRFFPEQSSCVLAIAIAFQCADGKAEHGAVARSLCDRIGCSRYSSLPPFLFDFGRKNTTLEKFPWIFTGGHLSTMFALPFVLICKTAL